MSNNSDMQRLQDMVEQVDMGIVLRGLFFDNPTSSRVYFCPQIRRSSPTAATVQHLDIVSCWKALSEPIASELAAWNSMFKTCLAKQIKEHMQKNLVQHLSRFSDATNESLLVSRMSGYLDQVQSHSVNIATMQLVSDMVSLFYVNNPGEGAWCSMPWTFGQGDVPSHVYNYIRAQDCFRHSSGGASVSFDLTYSCADGNLLIGATLQWQLPRVRFPGLPAKLPTGYMYQIKPRLNRVDLGGWRPQGLEIFKDSVTYKVSSSKMPFQSNENGDCFEAYLLRQPEGRHHIRTTMCVTVSTQFPGGVRFERISRYKIKLDVYNQEQVICNDDSSICGEIIDQNCMHTALAGWLLAPQVHTNVSGKQPSHCAGPLAMHSSSSPSPSDKVASPQSIASYRKANGYKRKISPGISIDTRGPFALDKFERPDLEVLAKRQRLDLDVRHDQQDETDTEWLDPRLVDIITGPLGEAHQSPVLEKDEPNNQDDFKSESSLKQFTAKLGGSKYTKFAWDSLIQSTMSKMLPPSPSHSSVDDSTPSNTAFEATSSASTTLLQDEIRRNYVEFVQRNQQRAAERAYYMETVPGFDGVVSPTDEYDEAFERIFLESSDGDAGMDWETDADDVEM